MGEGQMGWDWMSLQFENDTELMLYRIRREDGSADRYSSGTFVDASGKTRHLTSEEFRMTPGKTWASGKSGARYPVEWGVTVDPLEMEFAVATPLESQEVASERRIGPNYWEGAIRVQGSAGGTPVRGAGYLEMTGYDEKLSWGEGVE
jgi:predicted secreted hydrolase